MDAGVFDIEDRRGRSTIGTSRVYVSEEDIVSYVDCRRARRNPRQTVRAGDIKHGWAGHNEGIIRDGPGGVRRNYAGHHVDSCAAEASEVLIVGRWGTRHRLAHTHTVTDRQVIGEDGIVRLVVSAPLPALAHIANGLGVGDAQIVDPRVWPNESVLCVVVVNTMVAGKGSEMSILSAPRISKASAESVVADHCGDWILQWILFLAAVEVHRDVAGRDA